MIAKPDLSRVTVFPTSASAIEALTRYDNRTEDQNGYEIVPAFDGADLVGFRVQVKSVDGYVIGYVVKMD